MSSTVVSCPGKVLIAGGYLVLDRAYAGVVVSTSSRFYTVIENAAGNRPLITVRSPQFLNATWIYTVSLEPSVSVQPSEKNESNNKFVHLALQNILAIASELKGIDHVKRAISSGIDISIVGDNDFYSQRAQVIAALSRSLPRTLSSLAKIPPFVPTGVALSDVHKTGLGSSAALITSLVSSLLVHLSVISPADLDDTDTLGRGRRLAHNLAQYIHCLAQGKVGSGFDVSAAVFGSHIYTRFDPVVLQRAMSDGYSGSLLPVVSPTNEAWNYEIGQFQLPPLTRMMLADVDAGSDTPSLVGKVLKWRKEDSATSHTLWTALDILNQSLARTLLKLRDQYAENKSAYTHTLALLASSPSSQWGTLVGPDGPIVSAFQEVHRISEGIREKMREMGTLAGVPIEPIEQTRLLDLCISQPGVIAGGVPGAGGYDALWLLVCDPETAEQHPARTVESVWSTYSALDVSPLSAEESTAKGARIEQLDAIPGLSKAIAH